MVVIRCQSVIVNTLGLHLRAANQFVRLARQFQAEVRVSLEDKVANGKSILDLTTLAAGWGTRLELEANGPDAEAALAALVGLIEARFHEEEPL